MPSVDPDLYRTSLFQQFEKTAGKQRVIEKLLEIAKTDPGYAKYLAYKYQELNPYFYKKISPSKVGDVLTRMGSSMKDQLAVYELTRNSALTKVIPIKDAKILKIRKKSDEVLGQRILLRGAAGPSQNLHTINTYVTQYPSVAADYATGKIGAGTFSDTMNRAALTNPIVTAIDLRKVPRKYRHKQISALGPEHAGVKDWGPHAKLLEDPRYEAVIKGQLSDLPEAARTHYRVTETKRHYFLEPVEFQAKDSPQIAKAREFLQKDFKPLDFNIHGADEAGKRYRDLLSKDRSGSRPSFSALWDRKLYIQVKVRAKQEKKEKLIETLKSTAKTTALLVGMPVAVTGLSAAIQHALTTGKEQEQEQEQETKREAA